MREKFALWPWVQTAYLLPKRRTGVYMINNEYKPVTIFGVILRIGGDMVRYHKGRDEYAMERYYENIVQLNEHEQAILDHALAWEKAELDAADQRDDDGKNCARTGLW